MTLSKDNIAEKIISKKGWIITVVLILIIIPLLISVLSYKKVTVQKKPGTTLVGTVANQPIYLTDIQKVGLEQYQEEAIDAEVLGIAYDILVERLILDKAAEYYGITISDQEILESLTRSGTKNEDIDDLVKKNTKYDLLKNKILKKEVESREAFSIGFYIASYDEENELDFTQEEKERFAQQRAEGSKALIEISQRLKQGEIPVTLARDILKKYPSLQPVLAVNGYTLQSTTDESVLITPKVYSYQKENVGQPFYDAMYNMQFNEIKQVTESDGSGGYVIQIKSISHATVRTYEDWLALKKKDLVKTHVTL